MLYSRYNYLLPKSIVQQHFGGKYSFQRVPNQVGKIQKFQEFSGGGDKHPHLLTTMPWLKRDETCSCTEASISKCSTMFNCESVRLPNARLWSIGKRCGWVQLCLITEHNWSQSSNWSSIGFRLTTPKRTAVCTSNWKLVNFQRAFSNTSRTSDS